MNQVLRFLPQKRANRKPEALQYCYSYEKEEEWAAEDEMVRWHH